MRLAPQSLAGQLTLLLLALAAAQGIACHFPMAAIGNPYPAPQAATGLPAPPDRVLPEHSCADGMP